METFVALLRGINVGGKTTVPMKELQALLETAGCRHAKTYIQSGNAVFQASSADAKALEKRIGAAIQKSRGFEPRTAVLKLRELEQAAAKNPFPQADANPKSLHLFFLWEAPKHADLKALAEFTTATEKFALDGKVFYFYAPDGFGTSKAATKIGKCLGVDGTARNWRTVRTLIEMGREISALK
jgi:uncharacterized protein (DUF1697 family)